MQSFLLPLPSLGYHIPGKEVEVYDSGSRHHQLCRCHGVPTLPKQRGSLLLLPQNRVVLFPFSTKAALSSLSSPHQSRVVLWYDCTPGFKSQHQCSSAAPCSTTPTIRYTCQHSCILPALLGCHSKSGQVWPHCMDPIFSKLSSRCCNQGELLPSYILGGSHSHLPSSKHSHSYLTYP